MFSLHKWRDLTSLIAKAISTERALSLSIISPFGFEVLNDYSRYLMRALRRYYIYIGIAEPIDPDESYLLQLEYLYRLYAACRQEFPELFRTCTRLVTDQGDLLVRRRTVTPIKDGGDSAISVEVRSCTDILDEYAKYLVWAAFAIHDGTFPELGRVAGSRMARRRVLQVHLMHLHIFDCVGVAAGDELLQCFLMPEGPSEEARFVTLLNTTIKTENAAIVARLSNGVTVGVHGTGLHGAKGIECDCNHELMTEAMTFIRATYFKSGLPPDR